MRLFLLFFILIINTGVHSDSTTVYLCDSSHAKRYHLKSNCKGLSNCSHKVIKTTLEKAKQSGKTLCGWEK